ncbi:MAG: hypothetical protein KGJ78_01795 [Alphaproteobacteria bacterium]|nr:hypothetical protein [Alphaproteobacteria bacterium]
MDQRAYRPALPDLAVIAKTGRSWEEWFDVLDQAGASKLEHKAIARLLGEKYRVGPWWRRMVALEYEKARGMRATRVGPGYSVRVSRTMEADLARMYDAVVDSRRRRRWIPSGVLRVTSLAENKSIHAAWGAARLDIHVRPKPGGKAQIAVDLSRLEHEEDVERQRSLWKKALVKLEAMLID